MLVTDVEADTSVVGHIVTPIFCGFDLFVECSQYSLESKFKKQQKKDRSWCNRVHAGCDTDSPEAKCAVLLEPGIGCKCFLKRNKFPSSVREDICKIYYLGSCELLPQTSNAWESENGHDLSLTFDFTLLKFFVRKGELFEKSPFKYFSDIWPIHSWTIPVKIL